MSLIALVTGIHFSDVEPFVGGSRQEPKARLLAEMERAGRSPSYGGPTLFRIRSDLFALMANHEYGVSAMDAAAISQATAQARSEVHSLVDALRALGPPWSGIRVVATAEQIGVREGRRIHGMYTVDQEDLREGARHADAICRVNFGVDVHATDPTQTRAIEPSPLRSRPYDIPLRALIARDVDGLLLAGRCISGDFLAHSSYRVSGDAAQTGQAAGVAAALAARADVSPGGVPWPQVQGALASLNDASPSWATREPPAVT